MFTGNECLLEMSCTTIIHVQGGKHIVDQEEEKHGEEEVLLMNTQDQKYVQMKLTSETRVSLIRQCACVIRGVRNS